MLALLTLTSTNWEQCRYNGQWELRPDGSLVVEYRCRRPPTLRHRTRRLGLLGCAGSGRLKQFNSCDLIAPAASQCKPRRASSLVSNLVEERRPRLLLEITACLAPRAAKGLHRAYRLRDNRDDYSSSGIFATAAAMCRASSRVNTVVTAPRPCSSLK
jgi:hypothetical protein